MWNKYRNRLFLFQICILKRAMDHQRLWKFPSPGAMSTLLCASDRRCSCTCAQESGVQTSATEERNGYFRNGSPRELTFVLAPIPPKFDRISYVSVENITRRQFICWLGQSRPKSRHDKYYAFFSRPRFFECRSFSWTMISFNALVTDLRLPCRHPWIVSVPSNAIT